MYKCKWKYEKKISNIPVILRYQSFYLKYKKLKQGYIFKGERESSAK